MRRPLWGGMAESVATERESGESMAYRASFRYNVKLLRLSARCSLNSRVSFILYSNSKYVRTEAPGDFASVDFKTLSSTRRSQQLFCSNNSLIDILAYFVLLVTSLRTSE